MDFYLLGFEFLGFYDNDDAGVSQPRPGEVDRLAGNDLDQPALIFLARDL